MGSSNWREDCLHFWGKELVGEYRHWCPEWDYLPVDETCEEFTCCLCFDDTNILDSLEGDQ